MALPARGQDSVRGGGEPALPLHGSLQRRGSLANLATQSGTRALGEARSAEFLARVRQRLESSGWPWLTATFVGYLTAGQKIMNQAERSPVARPLQLPLPRGECRIAVAPWQWCDTTMAGFASRWLDGIGIVMRLRRGGRAGPGDGMPVEDFWRWWAPAGRAAAEAGIGGAGFGGFTRQMTARVQAMHPDLAWELAPGRQAEHALIVTAAGVPERRRIAERWYQQAPAAGAVWEYHPAAACPAGGARDDLGGPDAAPVRRQ